MTPRQALFLKTLKEQPKGRASYSLTDYEAVQNEIGDLISRGFVKHRRSGFSEGVQITPAGLAYLGGEA